MSPQPHQETLGIQLAIDVFGADYSSLGYLKRFPIDTLKIDRSFVSGLGHDLQDTAIVHGVVPLARSLGLTVTAEGIETITQEVQIAKLQCDRAQGYFFARPLTPAGVEAMLPGPAHRDPAGGACSLAVECVGRRPRQILARRRRLTTCDHDQRPRPERSVTEFQDDAARAEVLFPHGRVEALRLLPAVRLRSGAEHVQPGAHARADT